MGVCVFLPLLGLHYPAFQETLPCYQLSHVMRDQRDHFFGPSAPLLWFQFQTPARPSNPFGEDSRKRNMNFLSPVKVRGYKL